MKKFLTKFAVKIVIEYAENLQDEFKDGIQKKDFIEALKNLVK